jgi:hypothetical protein
LHDSGTGSSLRRTARLTKDVSPRRSSMEDRYGD